VFVVFGVPRRERRTYKLWEEGGVAPAFVLEVSSRGTWLDDAGNKKALCARFGVMEYFLFDPEADYLDPPLQGFRRVGRELLPIEPDADGVFLSETLGLSLRLENLRLVLVDLRTGERLLRFEELERAKRDAEARARAAEDELARLRAELARREG
jgi:Putative restriction endonuclease